MSDSHTLIDLLSSMYTANVRIHCGEREGNVPGRQQGRTLRNKMNMISTLDRLLLFCVAYIKSEQLEMTCNTETLAQPGSLLLYLK